MIQIYSYVKTKCSPGFSFSAYSLSSSYAKDQFIESTKGNRRWSILLSKKRQPRTHEFSETCGFHPRVRRSATMITKTPSTHNWNSSREGYRSTHMSLIRWQLDRYRVYLYTLRFLNDISFWWRRWGTSPMRMVFNIRRTAS